MASILGHVPAPSANIDASFAEYTSCVYVLDYAFQPGGTTQYIDRKSVV